MNKYKTLNTSRQESPIEETMPQKLVPNRIGRATLLHHDHDQKFLSSLTSQKRIVFLKLPTKPQPYSNSFRSSLYESSLKRLKQQKVTLLKQTGMPGLSQKKKSYETLEQEAIRRALKESKQHKKQYKKNSLPVVHKIVSQSAKKHSSYYLNKIEDRKTFREDHSSENENKRYSENPLNRSTYEIDGTVLGFKNLKEKYLELRQQSLNNKRKSELLDKPQYRRHENEDQFNSNDPYDPKFKMQKVIKDHMNRQRKKDYFQTKVNGYKTIIYPPQKAHYKLDEEVKERKKELQAVRKQENLQINFIRKKRNQSQFEQTIQEHPSQNMKYTSLDLKHDMPERTTRKIKFEHNPEKEQRGQDCSPWETDAVNFDRF